MCNTLFYIFAATEMGLSGSSVKPISAATDSPPSECPMHKNTPNFSPAASAAGECPASFGAGQSAVSETDVDPKNMVSIYSILDFSSFLFGLI